MDSTLDLSDDFRDPRDDFRNGFVAAVTYLRGQRNPTDAQLHAATNELSLYRLTMSEFEIRLSGESHRSPIDDAPVRETYEHSSDRPNSSRWARRIRPA